jgi:putative peptide zinc metalloprotease protein
MAEEYPKLRKDLIITSEIFEGKTYYVIKDPITKRFFRIKEPEYLILQRLDGETSTEEVIRILKEQFDLILTFEILNRFISQVEKFGFLEGETSLRELSRLKYRAEKEKNILKKILFIKVKAFDPDKFLDKLLKRVKFFFTKEFFILSISLIILAILITISNWDDLGYSLKRLYHPATILKFWVAVFLMVLVHELGHALTCKYFGGEVKEMGFLLIYFQPAFFTNVSDAWMFKEKKKKLWVSFGGIYIHLVLWAFTTLLWRITSLDTALNSFLLVMTIASGILILFNFNPLIKLDGYYLLSDLLEIPNLRKKAFGYLNSAFKKNILKLDVPPIELTRKQKKTYYLYGTVAVLYSVILLGFIFLKVEKFLVSQLSGFGFLLFLLILYFIFKSPVQVFLAGTANFLILKKESFMRPKRLLTYGIIILAIILFLLIFKLELRISAECEIKAAESYALITLPDGYVQENLVAGGSQQKKEINFLKIVSTDYAQVHLKTKVKEGDKVAKGDTVAMFGSAQYSAELKGINAELQKAKAYLDLLKNWPRPEELLNAQDKLTQAQAKFQTKENELERAKQLHQQNLLSDQELERIESEYSVLTQEKAIAENDLKILKEGTKPEEIEMAQAEVKKMESEKEALENQLSASIIQTPISGMVTTLRQDSVFLEIENMETVKVLIKISEKDMDVVKPGLKVKAKVRSYPFKSFFGIVTQTPHQSQEMGNKRTFLVQSKIDNRDNLLKSGMTGHAKIYCGKRSLFNLLTRRIVRYLRVEIWSWW